MRARLFLIIFLSLFAIQFAWGQAPQTISYQGVLTDGNGVPLDGNFALTFKLYEQAADGSAIWEETQDVAVANGLFNIILGGVTALDLPFDQPYWLGISVAGGSELQPRIELTSSAYSLHARSVADGVVSTAKIQDGAVTTDKIADDAVTSAKIASGEVVKSIQVNNSSLTDDVTLAAGTNVTLTPSDNTITISAQGGTGSDNDWTVSGDDIYSAVSGNVGIGTTQPQEKLDVDGNIQASGTIKSGSSVTIDGDSANIAADQALELHVNGQRALRMEPTSFSPNLIGGRQDNVVADGIDGATISGGGRPGGFFNQVSADYGTVGGGFGNNASGGRSTISGGGPNVATASRSTVGGGDGNTSSGELATIGGGFNNTAEGGSSVIAGGNNNQATGSVAAIGGGNQNVASSSHATVSGGDRNEASATDATVGGGVFNTASGNYSTVGGGWSNTASGIKSTVGGGQNNRARGGYSVVSGGGSLSAADSNSATGEYSTIPGGRRNLAAGDHSFAAGLRAKANHAGAFVWADATNTDFTSTGDNQFLIRAAGGVGIGTSTPTEQLHVAGNILATGTITEGSSRTLKQEIESLSATEAATALSQLEPVKYRYKANPEDLRTGFIAEDVPELVATPHRKSLSPMDIVAVLTRVMQEQQKTISKMQVEIDALRRMRK